MKCQKILSNNQQCQAFAQKGKDFCFRHDPNNLEFALQASSKGGENRRLQGVYGDIVNLKTPEDINSFLGDVINAVWIGKVPVPVGSSMGFLCRCWLDAYEASRVNEKIEELENRLVKAGL